MLDRQSFITFQVYLSQILDLYSFIPKNKYVEDLIDTGASDDTDVSDESLNCKCYNCVRWYKT